MSTPNLSRGHARRASISTDISPGDAFVPLSEEFKPDSTRARFEELASTYRNTYDSRGRALSMLDSSVQKRESLLQLISMIKNGDLPPTAQMVHLINTINFDKMREYATTYQGKKVIDSLESSTKSGVRAFEDVNGNENAQHIVKSLDNVRKKSAEDRQQLKNKVKKSAEESKDMANSAGKDFLVLASGISTSSAFRKAISDLTSLVRATIQDKEPTKQESEPLIDRVRNLIIEVRHNNDVLKSLRSLNSLYTSVYSKGARAMHTAQEKANSHPAVEDLHSARTHTEDLFKRLGNGYDLSPMLSALGALAVLYRDNENVEQLVADTKAFGDWAINVDEEKLTSEEFESRGQDLLDKGRHVLTQRDRENVDIVTTEVDHYMQAVQSNPVLVDYKESVVGLMHAIAGNNLNSEERREHYRALRQDLMTNLPILMQTIRYVPLPRVAGMNDEIEFAADNIVLDLQHFVPEHMSFDMHSEVYPRAGMLKDKRAMHSHKGFKAEQFFYLTVTGVNCVAKRVAFYIKKKKGLPRVAEKGIADLVIGGRGMDIVIRVRKLHNSEKPRVPLEKTSATSGSSTRAIKDGITAETAADKDTRAARELDIVDVKVKLHDLDFRVRENKHNISSTLGILLMRPIAKKLIAKNIAKSLAEYLVVGDKLMAKHGDAAQAMVVNQSKKAFTSAKGAASKGVQASKTKIENMRSKGDKTKGKVQESAPAAIDKTAAKMAVKKDLANKQTAAPVTSANDYIATADEIAAKREQLNNLRRDSMIENMVENMVEEQI
ncbi:hypothetical protein LPJ66_006541 [Kickxella alabastrina]|uniref:Uncharacterized protein n=1 Tax=Kickxella alabastrina TaxID=61397 RepID=A0ACC1IDU6_9FUNG|nr:hypothetical protein LPJ66_006541 [Kickxella alabastrina]